MKYFPPFRLDVDNLCLWRADARVPLSPKAFAVLRHLVEHAGRLLSQNQLLDAVWRNLEVQPEILKKYILEIRKALGDQSSHPVYIETLSRLGYRFIAHVQETPAAPQLEAASAALRRIVGRDLERAALRAALAQAAAGRGGMLCLSGGTGTGKTALAEELLFEAGATGVARVMHGRCSEHVAGAEAYQPIREALVGLLGAFEEDPTGCALKALIRKLAAEQPLVLFIDDMHWADAPTVDLLADLACSVSTRRMLIVLTCRPAELRRTRHPFAQLKLLLQARGVCRKLRLEPIEARDTERYIALEFAGHSFPEPFSRLVHESADGNPLFMVELLRHLRERGTIAQTDSGWALIEELPHFDRDLPESVRSALQRKIDQLDDADRWLLSVAAVQGRQFDSAVLAHILKLDAAEVEERLFALEQHHGLARIVNEVLLPDGAKTLCCCFVHALCQTTLYASLTPSRRAALSAAVALARSLRDLSSYQTVTG
jgi:predicted ATPase/DNA-binding winged helix-turn-helix (wHTH) protein